MKVLESRASKLMPENFFAPNGGVIGSSTADEKDSAINLADASLSHHKNREEA